MAGTLVLMASPLYNSQGGLGNQQLQVESGLNLNLGRSLAFGTNGVSVLSTIKSDTPQKLHAIAGSPRGLFKGAANRWINGETRGFKRLQGQKQDVSKKDSSRSKLQDAVGTQVGNKNSVFGTKDLNALLATNGVNRFSENNSYISQRAFSESNKSNQYSQNQSSLRSKQNGYQAKNSLLLPIESSASSFKSNNHLSNGNGGSFSNRQTNLLYQQYIMQNHNSIDSENSSAWARSGGFTAGYLFNIFPLRSLSLLTAARETYSYSTIKAIGLQDPLLSSKRLQFGLGADFGVAGSLTLGVGAKPANRTTDNLNNGFPLFSLFDIQAEAGVKVAVNVGLGFSGPNSSLQPSLEQSLIWRKGNDGQPNYERAYLPFYENVGPSLQTFFRSTDYIATGLQLAAPASSVANFAGGLLPTALAKGNQSGQKSSNLKWLKSGFIGGTAVSALTGMSRIASQLPFVVTAADVIFGNLSKSTFSTVADPTVTISAQAYLNGSLSLLGGLVGGYTKNSGGLNFVIPKGVGYQYNTEFGYTVGGISKSLWNVRGSGTLTGDDTSGFIANTYLQGNGPSRPVCMPIPPVPRRP
jgi:hypothetical protein